MEFYPSELAKNETQIYTKIVSNFVKKISEKYNINDYNNNNKIMFFMKELLSSLYIIADLTAISYNDTKREIEKSFYEKNIGWSMNNAYHNIFNLITKIEQDTDNNLNIHSYLLNDMNNFTHTYSKIKYWNKEMIIPSEEEYKNTIINKFPKIFFAKLLQNFSDKIDDDDYNKILNFIIKFIICRNFRDDYKYFFENYLRNYDEYTTNFLFIYLDEFMSTTEITIIKELFKNVKTKDNKIKILEILNNNSVPNKIYDKLKILQNEIVRDAKILFNMKYI